MQRPLKLFAAEIIGTFVLVMVGLGAIVMGTDLDMTAQPVGRLGVAVAFGFAMVAMTYAVGVVSGCHLNPAVSIGMWLTRRIEGWKLPFYLVGQFLGAFGGALAVWLMAKGHAGFDATGRFGQLGWGRWSPEGYGFWAVLLAEVLFSAVLVFVALAATHRRFSQGATGLASGMAYVVSMLVLLPIDQGGANPARAVASAIIAGEDAAKQVWLFLLAPIVGAAVAVLCWLAIDDARLEDTRLSNKVTVAVRDVADDAVDRTMDVVEKVVD